MRTEMHDKLTEIFKKYEGEKGAVITVLQKIQEKLGYLSKEAISEAAKFLRMSETEIFGIASFYAQFRFTPRGKHSVRVCLGTACHVRGGEGIMKAAENKLGIERGGTTKDQKFSIERVACFGSCALSPVMVVDKDVYGRMTPTKVKNILSKIK
jgi:NADH-quinone oxidoreductase subunit E